MRQQEDDLVLDLENEAYLQQLALLATLFYVCICHSLVSTHLGNDFGQLRDDRSLITTMEFPCS
ncbi:hypothetical protein BT96DRAFT_264032 [Gymnopus androsaceus JB14]|uniref:Uncharacterized protein n=1 Tax=Gymnopus androsaceus JB14 TaxID=1447944 RepID=A0A6A4GAI5_9AGAR|nr:hypothetical protein BT96DRAFT_264032 [Gymnopus androsaceus JB14]